MDFDFLQQGAMLAPMAGVTDMPFRVICHEMGCPMAVSEMVSAKGYLLSPKGNRAAQELLSVDESEKGAVALQLFGHEPDVMARAAEELTADGRYALLDINMGCPGAENRRQWGRQCIDERACPRGGADCSRRKGVPCAGDGQDEAGF